MPIVTNRAVKQDTDAAVENDEEVVHDNMLTADFEPPEGYYELPIEQRVAVLERSTIAAFTEAMATLQRLDEPPPMVISWWGPSDDLSTDDIWRIMAAIAALDENRTVIAQHCYNPNRIVRSFVIYSARK